MMKMTGLCVVGLLVGCQPSKTNAASSVAALPQQTDVLDPVKALPQVKTILEEKVNQQVAAKFGKEASLRAQDFSIHQGKFRENDFSDFSGILKGNVFVDSEGAYHRFECSLSARVKAEVVQKTMLVILDKIHNSFQTVADIEVECTFDQSN